MLSPSLRRLVVATGVSGVEVSAVLDLAERVFGVPTVKFEEFVEEEFRAPIYYAVELLLTHYHNWLEKLKKAFQKAMNYLNDSGSEQAIMAMHLTYHRRRLIVPNPALNMLMGLEGREIHIIHYVDDYYHTLYRIAERARKGETPGVARAQIIDPVGILYWRAADHNFATMASASGIHVWLFANKHSKEMHTRMLAMVLGLEYHGVTRFRSAYVSHPISKVKAKAREEGVDLNSFRDARDIEAFKERLERECKSIIFFSPTAIDELVVDERGLLKTRIERRDRWPHPEGIHGDYVYPVDLRDKLFDDYLYPVRDTVENEGYMKVVASLVESQIESRDLTYVSQADMVIAYRPTMYKTIHSGVETEIRVAAAQATPVYAVIPPEDGGPEYTLFRFEYPLHSVDELVKMLNC